MSREKGEEERESESPHLSINSDLVNVAGPSGFIHTFDCPAAGRESQRVLRIVSPAERSHPADWPDI